MYADIYKDLSYVKMAVLNFKQMWTCKNQNDSDIHTGIARHNTGIK